MTNTPRCKLCNTRTKMFFDDLSSYRVFRCINCRLEFVYSTPEWDTLERFYNTEYSLVKKADDFDFRVFKWTIGQA